MSFTSPLRLFVVVVTLVACAYSPYAQPSLLFRLRLPSYGRSPPICSSATFSADRAAPHSRRLLTRTYQFVAFKTTGTNPGYDVKDASGRPWSVKLGIEAQPEVTTSRILWAMGYPQPAAYFVHQFTLTGADAGVKTNARFRTDFDRWRPAGEWSWYENPFASSQPFRGLIVAQLILNNWDLKTTNNRIYEATDPAVSPRRLFMVRDVGSSLGHSKQFRFFAMLGTRGKQGSKNDIDGFEQQGFITKVDGNDVDFDYRGMNQAPRRHASRCPT